MAGFYWEEFGNPKAIKKAVGKLRKPLGTRASRPHLIEKCGHHARAPSKKRGFRRLPVEEIAKPLSLFSIDSAANLLPNATKARASSA